MQSRERFGRWTVVGEAGRNIRRQRCVIVICDCGTRRKVVFYSLQNGRTRSCGCLNAELARRRATYNTWRLTHGHSPYGKPSPTYKSWRNMMARCNNPNHPNYYRYGGRGIGVCKRWYKFENFLKDMGKRPEGTVIGRIDHDRGYSPSNCRWEGE
jgi:hypothetical protein